MTEEKRKRDEKTDAFIEKYLAIGKPAKGMTCYGMMKDAKGTCQKYVAFRIRLMDYKEFMNTVYWQLISWQVKKNNGWKCSVTGKRGPLEVHHWNYLHVHGYEMFHLDDLACVCPEEHEKIHEEMEAALEEYYVSRSGVYSN